MIHFFFCRVVGVGVLGDNKAISAFNYDIVEVDAELGKIQHVKWDFKNSQCLLNFQVSRVTYRAPIKINLPLQTIL